LTLHILRHLPLYPSNKMRVEQTIKMDLKNIKCIEGHSNVFLIFDTMLCPSTCTYKIWRYYDIRLNSSPKLNFRDYRYGATFCTRLNLYSKRIFNTIYYYISILISWEFSSKIYSKEAYVKLWTTMAQTPKTLRFSFVEAGFCFSERLLISLILVF
jgi:hypothetical protein